MLRVTRDTRPDQESQAVLEQAMAIMVRHFPPSIAHLFATPRTSPDGAREWWSELQGQPRRYHDLTTDEQGALLRVYGQRQDALRQLIGELQGRGQTQDAAVLQRLVGDANPDNLYSVNDQPLVIRWTEPVQIAPPAPPPPVVEPVPVTPRRRWFWLPWLLLLLALLLALALWFGWPWLQRWFHPPVAETPVEQPIEQPVPAPELETPEPQAPVEPPPVEAEPAVVPEAPVSPTVTPATACVKPKEDLPDFTVVLDTSGSMQLSVDATMDDEAWFSASLAGRSMDPARLAQITRPPVRMTVAKQSLTELINNLQPNLDMRIVTFDGCRTPIDHGAFTPAQRPALIRGIQNLEAIDGTPLAASLEVAANGMDGRNREGVIVMFVDGPDGCDRNACEVAQRIARDQPKLKVNLVNISNNSATNCIADLTGGQLYTGANAAEVVSAIKQATKEVSGSGTCK